MKKIVLALILIASPAAAQQPTFAQRLTPDWNAMIAKCLPDAAQGHVLGTFNDMASSMVLLETENKKLKEDLAKTKADLEKMASSMVLLETENKKLKEDLAKTKADLEKAKPAEPPKH